MLSLVICFTFALSVSAFTYSYVSDEADVLSPSELEELEGVAAKLEDSYGVCVMICIANDTDGMTDEAYARWIYTENTDNENGIVLLHNAGGNTCATFASGSAENIFDGTAKAELRDAYDSNDTYYGGVSDYFELAESCLISGGDAVSDETDDEPVITVGADNEEKEPEEKEGVAFIWLPVSLVIGIVAGFLIIGSVASKNKSVKMQKNATVYTRSGSMMITGSADNFLYSNTERKEKPKNNN